MAETRAALRVDSKVGSWAAQRVAKTDESSAVRWDLRKAVSTAAGWVGPRVERTVARSAERTA